MFVRRRASARSGANDGGLFSTAKIVASGIASERWLTVVPWAAPR